MGIIPRAVRQLYAGIAARQEEAKEAGIPVPEFKVSATFLELYNEDIIDLVSNSSRVAKWLYLCIAKSVVAKWPHFESAKHLFAVKGAMS